jgi:hypothetical protein
MKDSVQQQQKNQHSNVYTTESGLRIDCSLLPAGRLTEELKSKDSKRFWHLVDRSAKQVSGMSMRCYWKLTKNQRDELRAVVFEHYNIAYTRVRKQWVYAITHPLFPNACKVGITQNVRSRMFQYQVGCPIRGYRLEYAREYQDVSEAIESVYRQLDGRRLKGEWFEVQAEEVISILTNISEECE